MTLLERIEAITVHRCTRCAYIYDEKDGDPTASVPSGTVWEALPEDWACPHCGIEKRQFESFELRPDPEP